MKTTRRRARVVDALANREAIRDLLARLRRRCAEPPLPASETQLVLFLQAVRHVERTPVSATRRGRPSRWPRQHLLSVAGHLRTMLEGETSGRVSLSSFVGQYLPLLRFPSDVIEALEAGEINLMEAAQLARITGERLGCTPGEARRQRRELRQAHTLVQGSQNRLRMRVKELLGEPIGDGASEITSQAMRQVVDRVDEMLEIDPADTRHLFWEEMKRLFYAMREIEPDDLEEDVLEDFMRAMDEVSKVLYRIERRRQQRQQQAAKMPI